MPYQVRLTRTQRRTSRRCSSSSACSSLIFRVAADHLAAKSLDHRAPGQPDESHDDERPIPGADSHRRTAGRRPAAGRTQGEEKFTFLWRKRDLPITQNGDRLTIAVPVDPRSRSRGDRLVRSGDFETFAWFWWCRKPSRTSPDCGIRLLAGSECNESQTLLSLRMALVAFLIVGQVREQ